jgi:Protein of unknown function (DUF4232)
MLAAGLLASGCSTAGHSGALGKSASSLGSQSSRPKPGRTHIAQYLPHTSPAAVAAPARSTPAASPAPASAPAIQPVAAGPGPCAVSGLRITIGAANGAAGSFYYPLQFTNISGVACTMYGYPGVSFVTEPGGGTIGGPALRDPAFPKELVTLVPGVTVHATLQVAIAQNYPAPLCKPVTAHWLQVFPPASYVPLYIWFTAQTCTGNIPSGTTLGIYVVRPGATGT